MLNSICCKKSNDYDRRWFTPSTEVYLCGHTTLMDIVI
ncbi:MAG: PhzF family phenazine biosynthesis protein [Sebaldella sp.]|nr:PhzF family phenazine biosynthesis protein [Sebaldella sp.]